MPAFTEHLALLVCMCLTGIATGDIITVHLRINSSHSSTSDCLGGQVGLTNTSILVHYRLYEDTSPVDDWTFLKEEHIGDISDSGAIISTNISVTGVQLRFLQLEHGGEGCNCWEVTNLNISVIAGVLQFSDVTTSNCHINGQNEQGRFCVGSASEARGVITPVVYFNSYTGDRCPGNSSNYLIAPKGRPLPENCSTTNPRM